MCPSKLSMIQILYVQVINWMTQYYWLIFPNFISSIREMLDSGNTDLKGAQISFHSTADFIIHDCHIITEQNSIIMFLLLPQIEIS